MYYTKNIVTGFAESVPLQSGEQWQLKPEAGWRQTASFQFLMPRLPGTLLPVSSKEEITTWNVGSAGPYWDWEGRQAPSSPVPGLSLLHRLVVAGCWVMA